MSTVSIYPPSRAHNIMSINAITSSSPENTSQHTSFTRDRKDDMLSKTSVQVLLKPTETSPPYSIDASNHRAVPSDRRFESLDMMSGNELPRGHMRNISEQTTTIPSSPSLSATTFSDSISDFNSSGSQHSLPHTPAWSFSAYDNKNCYINHVSDSVTLMDHPLNSIVESSHEKNQSKNLSGYLASLEKNANFRYRENPSLKKYGKKNGEGLATRRARNKVASAKYRAKKQALTHAMQDRIMQLATHVMSLRNELMETKKRETQMQEKYKRLVMALRHNDHLKENNNSLFQYRSNRIENDNTMNSSSIL